MRLLWRLKKTVAAWGKKPRNAREALFRLRGEVSLLYGLGSTAGVAAALLLFISADELRDNLSRYALVKSLGIPLFCSLSQIYNSAEPYRRVFSLRHAETGEIWVVMMDQKAGAVFSARLPRISAQVVDTYTQPSGLVSCDKFMPETQIWQGDGIVPAGTRWFQGLAAQWREFKRMTVSPHNPSDWSGMELGFLMFMRTIVMYFGQSVLWTAVFPAKYLTSAFLPPSEYPPVIPADNATVKQWRRMLKENVSEPTKCTITVRSADTDLNEEAGAGLAKPMLGWLWPWGAKPEMRGQPTVKKLEPEGLKGRVCEVQTEGGLTIVLPENPAMAQRIFSVLSGYLESTFIALAAVGTLSFYVKFRRDLGQENDLLFRQLHSPDDYRCLKRAYCLRLAVTQAVPRLAALIYVAGAALYETSVFDPFSLILLSALTCAVDATAVNFALRRAQLGSLPTDLVAVEGTGTERPWASRGMIDGLHNGSTAAALLSFSPSHRRWDRQNKADGEKLERHRERMRRIEQEQQQRQQQLQHEKNSAEQLLDNEGKQQLPPSASRA